MIWLTEPPVGLVVPPAPPVAEVASANGRLPVPIAVADDGETLEIVPDELHPDVVYNRLPLTPRASLRLRVGVIDRLLRAQPRLPEGYTLALLDGWRSPAYQAELLAYYRDLHGDLGDGYVADPGDPEVVAPHTTGGAVDLTLAYDGVPLALGTDFDAFDAAAAPASLEDDPPSVARDLRRLMTQVLTAEGLAPYPLEWWHWSYGEQWWAVATGESTTLYAPVNPSD